MSATLGAVGELERITGVKSIQRIPVPSGWDKHGSGRRRFLVAQDLSDNEALQVVLTAAQDFERTLILTPTQDKVLKFCDHLKNIILQCKSLTSCVVTASFIVRYIKQKYAITKRKRRPSVG